MSFFFALFRSLSAAAAFSGFGVPGTEIWFGLHLWVDDLHSGPFLGAFTAHFVDGIIQDASRSNRNATARTDETCDAGTQPATTVVASASQTEDVESGKHNPTPNSK